MVMKEPQNKVELARLPTHLHMAEECRKNHLVDNDRLGKVEQDLSLSTDADGGGEMKYKMCRWTTQVEDINEMNGPEMTENLCT